ncbi:MAG: YhbY family RNA-binding protein [Candidatus Pacearchaeota archaeon]
MVETLTLHIGKNGLTKEFIEHLALVFKTRRTIKVQLLKSATENRAEMEKVATEIIAGLPDRYNYRVIGFTIILMKRTIMKKAPAKKLFAGKHHRKNTNK